MGFRLEEKMFKLILVAFCVLKIVLGQKCLVVEDVKNIAPKKIRCNNVVSMMDIADEIKSNWTHIEIVNQASHAQFSNKAGKIVFPSFLTLTSTYFQ